MKKRLKNINICLMCTNISYAGAQRQMLELAYKLNISKYSTRICVFDEEIAIGNDEKLNKLVVDVVGRNYKFDILWIKKLIDYLRKHEVDLLYTFLPFANYVGLLVGKLAKVPIIIISERSGGYKTTFIQRKFIRYTTKLSDSIIVNSYNGRKFLKNFMKSDLHQKIEVVYNGRSNSVENGKSFAVNSVFSPEIKKLIKICLVGRLKPAKNHRMFFRMAKYLLERHSNLAFICVGDSHRNDEEYHKELMKWFSKLGIEDHFVFMGRRNDVFDILSQVDISVLTSEFEGLSNTMIESMMAGCPIVVTDVSDHSTIIEDGVNGFVVPVDDACAMARKVEVLLYDEQLRKQMGKNNIQKANKFFSVKRMVDKTELIFEKLISLKL